ncbi:SMP-30/gluconolactonase/LRE family protein [Mariniphaga sediminis]|uniref:Regucalcin n=1 Tax=Mariniphaga sediminis TaxID=1628158 RepID=A0A399D4W3_9BACT|nr:SMP-30/gluconolactonase/LRE family protein [Mariniphaga sediminis]RIH66453.1 SMP-30/gluconolactonase/LRE family protein [Mariniphaga sediminis]
MKPILLILVASVLLVYCSTPKKDKTELVLDTQSDLGEGAIWNHKTGELMWVNITGKILNFYNPKLKYNKEMFTGQMIGTVVPSESGKAMIALENGFYQFDPETGSKHFIIDPEKEISGNRFNDGKCDPAGRFWAGTMSLEGKKKAGALYRLDPDSTVHKMIEGVTTSNGIVWSRDHTKMYYIDTPTRKVMAWNYNNETGEISNPQTAIEVPEDMGFPDGMTIDSEGNVWIALWGGAAVGCWNPETGELLRTIDVPAKNVTSCAFGDDDLGTLYITTARQNTNEKELKKFPHAGGVFKIRPGVKGVEACFFKDEF